MGCAGQRMRGGNFVDGFTSVILEDNETDCDDQSDGRNDDLGTSRTASHKGGFAAGGHDRMMLLSYISQHT